VTTLNFDLTDNWHMIILPLGMIATLLFCYAFCYRLGFRMEQTNGQTDKTCGLLARSHKKSRKVWNVALLVRGETARSVDALL